MQRSTPKYDNQLRDFYNEVLELSVDTGVAIGKSEQFLDEILNLSNIDEPISPSKKLTRFFNRDID